MHTSYDNAERALALCHATGAVDYTYDHGGRLIANYGYDEAMAVSGLVDATSTTTTTTANFSYDSYSSKKTMSGPLFSRDLPDFATKYWMAEADFYYYGSILCARPILA